MGIISWIIVGLIASWLAAFVVTGGGFGAIGDIIVGVIGGLWGGWMSSSLFHLSAGVDGINLASIMVAFVGAVVLILILRLIDSRRRPIT